MKTKRIKMILFSTLFATLAFAQPNTCPSITNGDLADFKAINNEQIETAHFGKKYNRAWLEAVQNASIKSTADLISQTQVQLLVYEKKNAKCKNFSFLTPTSPEINEVWENQTFGSSPLSKLNGLYIPKDATSNVKIFHQNNTLILSEDADKWTLVHEFMHHNFHIQALKNGYDQVATNKRAIDTEEKLRKIFPEFYKARPKKIPEEFKIEEAISSFYDAVMAIDEARVHVVLEEAAIEYLLTQEFDNKRLTFVEPESKSRAASYVKRTSTQTLEYYFYYMGFTNFLFDEAKKVDASASIKQLEELKTHLQNRINELKKLRDWAEKISPSVLNRI